MRDLLAYGIFAASALAVSTAAHADFECILGGKAYYVTEYKGYSLVGKRGGLLRLKKTYNSIDGTHYALNNFQFKLIEKKFFL